MPENIRSDGGIPADYGVPPYSIPAGGKIALDPNTVVKDSISKSDTLHGFRAATLPPPGSDQPQLDPVDENKVNGSSIREAAAFLQGNPYLKGSFLANFFELMVELLNTETLIHFNEAESELITRNLISELAKASGALAKALTSNQAREQMVQAVMAFAGAAVASMSFMEHSRNLGAAKREAGAEIEAQKLKVKEAQDKAGIPVADQITDLQPNIDTPEVTAQKERLARMEANIDQSVLERVRRKDQQTTTLTDVQKQVISGIQGVLLASIKTDSSVKEEAQKLLDGFTQAANKFSESSSKQRDNAQANFDKFVDLLRSLVEKINQALNLSTRG